MKKYINTFLIGIKSFFKLKYLLVFLIICSYLSARITSPSATNLSEFNSLSILFLVLINIFNIQSVKVIKKNNVNN